MINKKFDSFKLTEKIVNVLDDKKAENVTTIKIGKVSIIADNFIICTGNSSSHVKALVDAVEKKLKDEGERALNISGYSSAKWVLMDYGSVFVHIFDPESREFYNIERLWSDGDNR